MNWFIRLMRKLFLIKEIVSKEGVVHFRRYRLLSTPWFNIYIHNILKSDEDEFYHDHPWSFRSLILKGSYCEYFTSDPYHLAIYYGEYMAGDIIYHPAGDAHQLSLLTSEVWTLVFTSGRERVWGYRTNKGWIDFKRYRQLKQEGRLP